MFSFAHEWRPPGSNEGDLLMVMGWTSNEMPYRYGQSAAAERAQELQLRFRIGEQI
jgi:integrase/recombinase XerC